MIPIRGGDVLGARVALLCIALGAFMAVVGVAAETSAQPVSDGRFTPLERGINLSHWFAQVLGASGYTREHLLGHTTVDDVALIKRLGGLWPILAIARSGSATYALHWRDIESA